MKTKTLLIPFFLLATSLNGFAQNNTNTFLGNQAGYNSTGSFNIFIGQEAGYGETGSYKLYIENSNDLDYPLIFGDFNHRQVSILGKPDANHALTVWGSIKSSFLNTTAVNADYLFSKYSMTFNNEMPSIFLGTGVESDLNRYLHIRNTEDDADGGISSGLKSGGILVSDDFNFANPSKNDLVAKRSIAIGKYVNLSIPNQEDPRDYPPIPLYVYNPVTYATRIADFEQGSSSETNISVRNTKGSLLLGVRSNGESYIYSNEGKLNIGLMKVLADKVGIGTASPAYKLDVNGTINATSLLVNGQPLSTSQWVTNGTAIGYTSGNVGIGTGSPGAKLSFSDLTGSADSDGITWYSPAPLAYGIYKTAGAWSAPDYQQLKLSWNTGIILDPGKDYGKSYVDVQGSGLRVTTGNVGIGIAHPTEKLQVNGMVYSTEVKVDLAAGTGPDYVFEPTYHLKPLEEIETYIKENKHLPEVPTAKEMEKNGVQLGEMNMLLLKKVEELTLYMIEQQKINKTQALEIEELKRLIKK
jgi:hypothetical protein